MLGVILDYLGLKWAFRVVLGVILDCLGLKWAITIFRVNGCMQRPGNKHCYSYIRWCVGSLSCMHVGESLYFKIAVQSKKYSIYS